MSGCLLFVDGVAVAGVIASGTAVVVLGGLISDGVVVKGGAFAVGCGAIVAAVGHVFVSASIIAAGDLSASIIADGVVIKGGAFAVSCDAIVAAAGGVFVSASIIAAGRVVGVPIGTACFMVGGGGVNAVVVMKLASLIRLELIIGNLFFSGRAFSFKGSKVTH